MAKGLFQNLKGISALVTNGVLRTTGGKGLLSIVTNAIGVLKNDGSGGLSFAALAATDVGLGSVENTALSTWTGTSNVTTLGTVVTATWHASIIGLAYGGSGSDLSATGGTGYVLKQSAPGAAITVGSMSSADLSDGPWGVHKVTQVAGDAGITVPANYQRVVYGVETITAAETLLGRSICFAPEQSSTVANSLQLAGLPATSYAYLPGRAGGQVVYGGTADTNGLTLIATAFGNYSGAVNFYGNAVNYFLAAQASIRFQMSGSGVAVMVDGPSATYRGFNFRTTDTGAGVPRSYLGLYSNAEAGASAGSDMLGYMCDDAGAFLVTWLMVYRATGQVLLPGTAAVTGTAAPNLRIDPVTGALTRTTAPPRTVLTAAVTYYVNGSTGNDANSGTSAGSPWLTIQHAIDVVCGTLDMGNNQVTIQVANGTYTGTIQLKPFFGNLPVILQGDTTTPTNVTLTSTSGALISMVQLYNPTPSTWTVQGFYLTTTGSGTNSILLQGYGTIQMNALDFGPCVSYQVSSQSGGNIKLTGNITISGGATGHIYCIVGASVGYGSTYTVTLTGTPAFSSFFAGAKKLATIYSQCLYSGAATGVQYLADMNSVIATRTADSPVNYFPGTASTGSTASGGQYV